MEASRNNGTGICSTNIGNKRRIKFFAVLKW
jgi:hypothetical protein